jgi:UDP-N-acetylmuramoyl-tripeptide--D-alanyl-D-alanine ligase
MHTSIEELYALFLENSSISTDSRQVVPGCLFFALKGDNFDGNRYAQKALDSGAAYAVIDDASYAGGRTLVVPDVLEALQQLARMHRRKFQIPVLAITGSNGKTTTKELITAVLCQQFRVTATRGNLNNHIGVPLTLLNITPETQIAIIEMGANHQLEIENLCHIAEPTHGLITNIGRAHLGGFGGYEGVIKAKNELYNYLRTTSGIAFVNADNTLLMELSSGLKRTMYGSDGNNHTQGKASENMPDLEVEWVSGSGVIPIKTNLVGHYNFENVLAAICIGSSFGVPSGAIKTAISLYSPSNSRSQALRTEKNSIILDAYNANPSSMKAAIENFRQMKAPNKMVVLGDMLELGEESAAEHLAIVDLVESSGFDRVLLVGPDFTEAAKGRFPCFPNSEAALQWLRDKQIKDSTILIKGSRGIKMEKVLEAL